MSVVDGLDNFAAWSALGWAVVHFLWQGAIIGLLVAAVLRGLRARPAEARYGIVCGGMALSLATFGATFLIILRGGGIAPGENVAVGIAGAGSMASMPDAPAGHDLGGLGAWCWAIGFLWITARYCRNWFSARRLGTRMLSEPDAYWRGVFRSLKEKLGVWDR